MLKPFNILSLLWTSQTVWPLYAPSLCEAVCVMVWRGAGWAGYHVPIQWRVTACHSLTHCWHLKWRQWCVRRPCLSVCCRVLLSIQTFSPCMCSFMCLASPCGLLFGICMMVRHVVHDFYSHLPMTLVSSVSVLRLRVRPHGVSLICRVCLVMTACVYAWLDILPRTNFSSLWW